MAPRTATPGGAPAPAPHLDPDRADARPRGGAAQHREAGGEPVAAGGRQAGGHPVDAGEGVHQQQRVGQRGPVAVGGADRVGEPAQLAARAALAAQPAAVAPVEGRAARGPGGAGGRRPGRRCRAWRRGSRRPRRSSAAAWRASTQVSPGEKAAPTTSGTPRALATGPRSSRARTSAMASEADTTGTSAVDQLAGQLGVAARRAWPGRPRRPRAAR